MFKFSRPTLIFNPDPIFLWYQGTLGGKRHVPVYFMELWSVFFFS